MAKKDQKDLRPIRRIHFTSEIDYIFCLSVA